MNELNDRWDTGGRILENTPGGLRAILAQDRGTKGWDSTPTNYFGGGNANTEKLWGISYTRWEEEKRGWRGLLFPPKVFCT